MKKHGLDATDIRILSAVEEHGPLSKAKLAEIVNLSPTPCLARLNRLKAAGYIRGYHADIALDRIGDFAQVIVTVSLAHHRKTDFERFEAHIRRLDDVTECNATGGGMEQNGLTSLDPKSTANKILHRHALKHHGGAGLEIDAVG